MFINSFINSCKLVIPWKSNDMMQTNPRQITTKLFISPPTTKIAPYINKFYLFYKQKHHEKAYKTFICNFIHRHCIREMWCGKNSLWELKFRATRWIFLSSAFFSSIKHKFIRYRPKSLLLLCHGLDEGVFLWKGSACVLCHVLDQ